MGSNLPSGRARLGRFALDAIREKADIVEVVGSRVDLKRAGREYKGLCPFHADKSPSFCVSPAKQIYKCFACGAGGDVFEFVSKFEGVTFAEAATDLARRYGVALEADAGAASGAEGAPGTEARLQALRQVCEAAAEYFESALWGNGGDGARAHLLEARGLDEGTVRRFRLGYAPPYWTAVSDHLCREKRFAPESVQAAGLAVPRSSGNGHYDRFRGRVVIPILDARGRVVAFGGRSLDGGEPKYLNSPETELFEKGKILFALDKAREAITKEGAAIAVEGYFDAIALHRHGVKNAVAVLGTAMGMHQAEQLLCLASSRHLVLAFDNDAAGAKAAERATEELAPLIHRSGARLGVLELPDAKDADEFLRTRGGDEYQKLVAAAPNWFDWRANRVLAESDSFGASGLERALGSIAGLLALPMDVAVREKRLQEAAGRLARGGGGLALKIGEALRRRAAAARTPSPAPRRLDAAPPALPPACRAEAQILAVYLHRADLRDYIHEAAERHAALFEEPFHARLWSLLKGERHRSAEAAGAVSVLREALAGDTEAAARLEGLLWPKEDERTALERPGETVRAALAFLLVGRCEVELGKLGALCDEAEARRDWEESARLMGAREREAGRLRELRRMLAFGSPT